MLVANLDFSYAKPPKIIYVLHYIFMLAAILNFSCKNFTKPNCGEFFFPELLGQYMLRHTKIAFFPPPVLLRPDYLDVRPHSILKS